MGINDYISIVKSENSISICLQIESDKLMTIGEKINSINEEAYMNGYNWEAFLNYYIEKNEPELLIEMDTDSEAGMYVASYNLTIESEIKAKKLVNIITSLIENEVELYRIITEEGNDIEWD